MIYSLHNAFLCLPVSVATPHLNASGDLTNKLHANGKLQNPYFLSIKHRNLTCGKCCYEFIAFAAVRWSFIVKSLM
jgi:hypothetical protein